MGSLTNNGVTYGIFLKMLKQCDTSISTKSNAPLYTVDDDIVSRDYDTCI